jgi:hypothetical protein
VEQQITGSYTDTRIVILQVVIGTKTLNNIKDNQESQILNNFLTQAYVLLTNIYLKYMKTNNNKKCCVTQQRAGIVLVDID